MNSIENMLCIFCKNTTITTTEINSNVTFNKSTSDEEFKSNMYSICNTCNKYSYIKPGTLLYSETSIKNANKLIDIKYDPKLIEISSHCSKCNEERQFKQFANNNNDLKYKYICTTCDSFYNSI